MKRTSCRLALAAGLALAYPAFAGLAHADDQARHEAALQNLKHVIVVKQENHSFDNYFGAIAYVPGSPYHSANGNGQADGHGNGNGNGRDNAGHDNGGCGPDDHRCVDGLTCQVQGDGSLSCANVNINAAGQLVHAFHDANRCVGPDLDHGWVGSHNEANFADPNAALRRFHDDGFVRQNFNSEGNVDETMGFYTQADIPFYDDLAQKFAISDRHFCSLLGPTFPNRSYSLAATSFGHLTTNEERDGTSVHSAN